MRFRGDRLKGVRNAKRMTLKELAERCRVHHSRLGRYETGPDEPRAANLAQMADGLEISSDYLLDGKCGDDVPYGTVAARESLELFLRANSGLREERITALSRVAEDSGAPTSIESWEALVRHFDLAEAHKLGRQQKQGQAKAKSTSLRVVRRTPRSR